MMQPQAPKFIRVAGAAALAPGSASSVSVGAYDVALFNVDGEFYALENSCPHQGGPLADGWLEGSTITCPWHGWCFEVRSGKMTLGEFARVARFAVRREGSDLLIGSRPLDEEDR
ncbi:MAG: Rieske (2Fe-2S) protein [Candidatus Baltobacteraceae bacterium]